VFSLGFPSSPSLPETPENIKNYGNNAENETDNYASMTQAGSRQHEWACTTGGTNAPPFEGVVFHQRTPACQDEENDADNKKPDGCTSDDIESLFHGAPEVSTL